MEKIQSRRTLIRYLPAGVLLLWAALRNRPVVALGQQDPPPGKTPPPPPNPFGKDGQLKTEQDPLGAVAKPGETPKTPRKDLKADEMDIRKQVTLLAAYADELKKEVEKTDSTKVLSVEMLRKTQDIEKLAHHIAKLAAG